MKVIIACLVIIASAFLVELFLPWWSLLIVCAIVCFLFRLNYGLGFLAGFLGIAILWAAVAIWIDVKNQSILSEQIGTLFGGISSMGIIAITAFLGGLIGGMGSLVGISARKVI